MNKYIVLLIFVISIIGCNDHRQTSLLSIYDSSEFQLAFVKISENRKIIKEAKIGDFDKYFKHLILIFSEYAVINKNINFRIINTKNKCKMLIWNYNEWDIEVINNLDGTGVMIFSYTY